MNTSGLLQSKWSFGLHWLCKRTEVFMIPWTFQKLNSFLNTSRPYKQLFYTLLGFRSANLNLAFYQNRLYLEVLVGLTLVLLNLENIQHDKGQFICLSWFLMCQSTIFHSCWMGRTSIKQRINCLAQEHNTVPLVRLKPATRSQVKHSTTEPLHSCWQMLTLKVPITTAADDKFCEIFPNFWQK